MMDFDEIFEFTQKLCKESGNLAHKKRLKAKIQFLTFIILDCHILLAAMHGAHEMRVRPRSHTQKNSSHLKKRAKICHPAQR